MDSAYCQLIRNQNKQKRLEWAHANLNDHYFDNLIWSNESSIQMDCNTAAGKQEKNHTLSHDLNILLNKVHVWTGISKGGPTGICIFEVIMDVPFSVRFLDKHFFQVEFPTPNSHRFMQDNDPKHCCAAQRFYDEVGINFWHTPPESPNLNSIENLWHELKDHLRGVIKPRINWWNSYFLGHCE